MRLYMSKAIEVKNIVKYYGSYKVIDELNFEVEKSEIFGIVGPDGSGKTTLARLITGVINLNSGDIIINDFGVKKDIDKIRNIIGYMPQKFSLYEDLTVEENINFFADIYSVPKETREKRVEELYKFSHLENFKSRLAANLSGGMQKKLALTCALINFPKILILDEPTIGVDPLSRQELWEMLENLNKNEDVTILVTTNYMDEVERFDKVGLIYKGKFLLCDKPSRISGKGHTFEDIFISEIQEMEK